MKEIKPGMSIMLLRHYYTKEQDGQARKWGWQREQIFVIVRQGWFPNISCIWNNIVEDELQDSLIWFIFINTQNIERFSNGCREANTEVITPTNHNTSKQRDEPIRIPSNYLKLAQSAGLVWFLFLVVVCLKNRRNIFWRVITIGRYLKTALMKVNCVFIHHSG